MLAQTNLAQTLLAKKYDVFRISIGPGLVDYCGTLTAVSHAEAVSAARREYPVDQSCERLDVDEMPNPVLGRGQPAYS